MTRKDIIIKLIIGFIIQAAILSAFIYLSYSRFNSYEQAVKESYRAKTIDSDINKLEKSVLALNSDVRGYSITGNKSFLDQYDKNKLEVNNNNIEQVITDVPYQSERAATLKKLIREKIDIVEKYQIDATPKELPSLVVTGELLTQNIRQVTQQMREREALLLADRTKEADEKAADFQNYIVGLVISNGIFLLLGVIVLGKSYFFRLDLEQDLNQSNEELKVVYNSIHDSLITINENSMIIYCNESVQEMFGYTPKELIGRNLTDLMPEKFREAHLKGMSRYLKSGKKMLDWKAVEISALKKSGEEFPVAISFGEYDIKGSKRFIGVIRDTTERALWEQEILKINVDLTKSNKLLEEFTYVSSHDLISPVRVVKSYSELLLNRFGEQIPQGAKEYLQKIQKSTDKMIELISDLLEYSRSGKQGESVIIDTNLLVLDIISSIEEHNCKIKTEPLPSVLYNETSLRQIFTNLITNAIKFNGHRCGVVVGVEDQDNYYRFDVSDSGVGIDSQYFETIFQPFKRLNSDTPGSGIGLSIVKRLVELNGGKVWVESPGLGKGSTFFFTVKK